MRDPKKTKCDAIEDICDGYRLTQQKRPNKYHGQSFNVRDSVIEVAGSDVKTDKKCYLTFKRKK